LAAAGIGATLARGAGVVRTLSFRQGEFSMLKHLFRLGTAALAGGAIFAALASGGGAANDHANYQAVCPGAPSGTARCHADVATDEHGNPDVTSAPKGLSPLTIKSAYGFPTSSTAGSGKTIAIVDAYDDPTAASDFAVFDQQYGLQCNCLTKVDQTGGTSYPRADPGWALEISLDVQWAHAVAPGAQILLVEANSNSFSDLLAAEDYANSHADYVSNSWGGSEFSGESSYDSHFAAGKAFVSSGDAGLPAEYPSASPKVISVGGTTLNFSGGSFSSETGWSGSGGGCSQYENATSAQSSFSTYGQVGCGGKRATPDVSLDADPASGVAVYDSTRYQGKRGWWTVGGTSASSPMWAARAADSGATVNASYVYGNSITFRDILSGNNGASALNGFDLVTGRGSWTGSTP
jgi:subtilase family serine protease